MALQTKANVPSANTQEAVRIQAEHNRDAVWEASLQLRLSASHVIQSSDLHGWLALKNFCVYYKNQQQDRQEMENHKSTVVRRAAATQCTIAKQSLEGNRYKSTYSF